MGKKFKIVVVCILIILLCLMLLFLLSNDTSELRTIKSDKELSRIYDGEDNSLKNALVGVFTMPFSLSYSRIYNVYNAESSQLSVDTTTNSVGQSVPSSSLNSSPKDYSTTNIQVENVDEADIVKTDGDYIYSISENKVIITNAMNPENIKIEATLNLADAPEDLIIYKNELVVISAKKASYSYNNTNTTVSIYNIATKSNPTLMKSYELYEPYYTSRCINNMLYIISSGYLREENDKVVRAYKENNIEKEIALDNIKYLKDVKTRKQTVIAVTNLDNIAQDINVSSYLMDVANAYVSENSIYLLEQKYKYSSYTPTIDKLFGFKGVIGLFDYDYYEPSSYKTNIYKFNIEKDGNVSYACKGEIKGRTINQYSIDEQNGNLRIAVYDSDGARVGIFDENLKQIGISPSVAKGETMYSSRFMGNKVYLVTYETVDPLFVIDLSDETNPKVLGELKIPGYSTYLHPYDENHLIGIGMETEEVVNRNSSGKVTSITSKITGMKMALFDVTNVNIPIQISETVIGDSRTTSAILTNPKALLFSKEKELIAIPVNNYNEDFEIASSNSYQTIVNSYTNYGKSYVAEGYFVYNINLKDGFKLKGIITHENTPQSSYNYYYNNSKLLRGLYIEDNLYTVSENAIKVNRLDTLEQTSELKIK